MAKAPNDVRIQDRKLERELIEHLDFMDADTTKEILKRHRAAKKAKDDAVALMKLKPGQRLRVGPHTILGAARAGGGFKVPTWTKTVGNIEHARGED